LAFRRLAVPKGSRAGAAGRGAAQRARTGTLGPPRSELGATAETATVVVTVRRVGLSSGSWVTITAIVRIRLATEAAA
jgi:hypothetical protein